jgi:hypothetical protein
MVNNQTSEIVTTLIFSLLNRELHQVLFRAKSMSGNFRPVNGSIRLGFSDPVPNFILELWLTSTGI